MTWDAVNRRLDLNNRPAFIVAGRVNMVHPVAMLHHRLPWNVLGNTLNSVLAGTVDVGIVNTLLSLGPATAGPLVTNFSTARTQLLAGKTLSATQVAAIEAVEAEIFSLPCNLFQGLNARADDPGDHIDFRPADIAHDGTLPADDFGALQKMRERLMAALLRPGVDLIGAASAASDWQKKWTAVGGGRNTATAFAAGDWAAAAGAGVPPPYANPAYRRWVTGLTILSDAESRALNAAVQKRVETKYY